MRKIINASGITEGRCSMCKRIQAVTEFRFIGGKVPHFKAECRTCERLRRINYYSEKQRTNPIDAWCRRALSSSKVRAKEKDIAHTLTLGHIYTCLEACQYQCAYCDIQVRFDSSRSTLNGGILKDCCTLDRIESSEGYTLANVVICCWHCNTMKNDSTPADLYRIANRLECLIARKRHVVS